MNYKSAIEQYVEESDFALLVLKGELKKTYKLFRIDSGVYELRPKSLTEQIVEEAMLKGE